MFDNMWKQSNNNIEADVLKLEMIKIKYIYNKLVRNKIPENINSYNINIEKGEKYGNYRS